ncbi:helix-turn-helix domain-containing protein [Halobacillus sp. H74]|uniref:helix-turn-helix domain-containing protein n=1 Tax=Halobacillus sp. H74 TaxID=3457436 RepID=UPI003FCE5745
MKKGALLKYYRKQKDMSQEEVSEGIVSPSYLSKIENNQINAADETMNLLFKRIGIDSSHLQQVEDEFKSDLTDWERTLLTNDPVGSKIIHEKLQANLDTIKNIELLLDFHVKLIRYHIINTNFNAVGRSLEIIQGVSEHMNNRTEFFYHKHLGNYLLNHFEYEEAQNHLELATNKYSVNTFSRTEKADLYYLYSICLARLRRDAIALEYAKEALDIYRDKYLLKECANTHVQLGASNSRIQNYEIAQFHYDTAKDLALQLKLTPLLGIIEHNIANLKLKMNKYTEAIDHLEICLEYKSESYNTSYFTSLILLVSVNYRANNLEEAQKWVKEGMHLKNKYQATNLQKLELKFFHKLLLKSTEEWEAFIMDDFISYLESNHKWYHLITYSKIIATYFKEKFSYKKSTYYYELAVNAYQTLNRY